MTITADSFVVVDTLTRARIEQHPIWRPYDEDKDRETILGWGVSAETLDQQLAKVEFCGTQPIYPVLTFDPLPPAAHLIIAVSFTTASGSEIGGYLFRPYSFGVYVGDQEFSFNRNLPGVSKRSAVNLGAALGQDAESVFPMRYASRFRDADGSVVEGRIECFW